MNAIWSGPMNYFVDHLALHEIFPCCRPHNRPDALQLNLTISTTSYFFHWRRVRCRQCCNRLDGDCHRRWIQAWIQAGRPNRRPWTPPRPWPAWPAWPPIGISCTMHRTLIWHSSSTMPDRRLADGYYNSIVDDSGVSICYS